MLHHETSCMRIMNAMHPHGSNIDFLLCMFCLREGSRLHSLSFLSSAWRFISLEKALLSIRSLMRRRMNRWKFLDLIKRTQIRKEFCAFVLIGPITDRARPPVSASVCRVLYLFVNLTTKRYRKKIKWA